MRVGCLNFDSHGTQIEDAIIQTISDARHADVISQKQLLDKPLPFAGNEKTAVLLQTNMCPAGCSRR